MHKAIIRLTETFGSEVQSIYNKNDRKKIKQREEEDGKKIYGGKISIEKRKEELTVN